MTQNLDKCDDCDYRTVTKDRLKRHMMKHTGERPYKCDQCKYSAARKWNYIVHLKIHERPKKNKN